MDRLSAEFGEFVDTGGEKPVVRQDGARGRDGGA